MPEPPKRTNLRSSPEDAAFYRQFHDHALSALRNGTPREQLLKDLADKGVPEKTAARIVIAVEQELALQTAGSSPPGRKWKVLAFIIAIWGSIAGYIAWQMTKDGAFHWKYLAGAGAIATFLSYRTVSRSLLRMADPNPPPPPPDRGGR
jgi:hypothetical protein